MHVAGADRADGARLAFSPEGEDDQDLEHDPEKWEPVFGKDHAQIRS
jgi:hypothetical protein